MPRASRTFGCDATDPNPTYPAAHRSIADLQQLTDESSEAPARPNAHGWVRHFALRVCEPPHTLARGYCASARNTLAIAGGGQE